ncbi:MAG TPA: aspartate aminotransferase family protein [Solirubrobacteraceae bacterium]|nr:aspartate aminotransferase family protein [Solirubrobacteraceae bacterium]
MTAIDALATDELQELAHRHLLMHFTRNGAFGPGGNRLLVLERGEGPYVFDTDGKRYLDGLSSLFCCQIGYSFGEEMAAVVGEQMSTLSFNTNWGTAHPPAMRLAAALAERAPGDLNRVFFTSGGSESVETAWKIVRQHFLAKGEPQRTKAVAREIAYHGVTLGALSFTGVRPMKEPFGASPIPVVRVSNTNAFRHELADDPAAHCAQLLQEMEQAIVEADPATVAMIIAEPVQNAAGCLVPPDGYWPALRELADRYGIALVADEVITGFGRIGEWFAASRFGPAPDVITVAKGITSAYAPMGAVLVADRIAEPLYDEGRMLLHGITFGGHPLAAAVALRNIEIFEREGVLENVREHEDYLRERLEELRDRLPIVGDMRGAGYFWALELVRDGDNTRFSAEERERLLRGFLARRLLDEGLIARPDDRGDAVLHLAPPLISGRREIDELVEKTGAVLADASERFFAGA